MLQRELEPEVMDDPLESRAYDEMQHAEVNRKFVEDLLACEKLGELVLDLGTGTARIPIELCQQFSNCRIVASDAATSMLEIARKNVARSGLEQRIELHCGDAKQLDFDDGRFPSVISNSLIHHIPEPIRVLREMLRVVQPGGLLFIRDLMRPRNLDEVERLVENYAGGESPECRQLLRQSLIAALDLDEIRDLISSLGLRPEAVEASSDRHWTIATTRPA